MVPRYGLGRSQESESLSPETLQHPGVNAWKVDWRDRRPRIGNQGARLSHASLRSATSKVALPQYHNAELCIYNFI